MKKQVAILLLCCYAIVLVRPVIPCISDLLAHTFWESEHITTVHYENGKYHMHLELKKAGEESPVKNDQQKNSEENIPAHFLSSHTFEAATQESLQFIYPEWQFPASSVFISVSAPPPWPC